MEAAAELCDGWGARARVSARTEHYPQVCIQGIFIVFLFLISIVMKSARALG